MTLGLAAVLDQAVRAVAPIVGVTVGNENDRSTWSVQFDPSATPEQRAAAANVLATFDVSTVAAKWSAQMADADGGQRAILATLAYIWRVTHGGVNPTGAQLAGELNVWKAIYKALP